MQAEAVRAEALRLSLQERAELAAELLKSLDGDEGAHDLNRVWGEQAERRYAAYKAGKLQGIPAEQVFRKMRSGLK